MLSQHKKLLIGTGVLAAVLGVTYAVLLHPLQSQVDDVRAQRDDLKTRLAERDWPLDPERLESLHREMDKDLERFEVLCKQVLEQSGNAFRRQMGRFTEGTTDDFRNVVSRLDYREEYSAVAQRRQGRVAFDEDVLGLGENSDSIYVYQLLLHLWTVEALTGLALDCGLKPVPHPEITRFDASGRRQRVSQISIEPMQAYKFTEEDGKPYLLEFPVRMVVSGDLESLGRFLARLQTGEQFFPLGHVELRKQLPPMRLPAQDRVQATLVCSSFFLLEEKAEEGPRSTERKLLPPGA